MKKRIYFALVLCLSMASVASAVSAWIVPGAQKIGHLRSAYVGYNGSFADQTKFPDYTKYVYGISIGNSSSYDLGVIKFKLPSTITPSVSINSAKIEGYCVSGDTGTIYIKIQRYANDNTTLLNAADHPDTASLVDVAIVPTTVDPNGVYFSWDVTSGVAADVAAGKTHSSFLVKAVQDAAGNPLSPARSVVVAAEGWDVASTPHLNINNSLEPVATAKAIFSQTGKIGRLKKVKNGYNGVSTTQDLIPGYISNIGDYYGAEEFDWDLGVFKYKLPTDVGPFSKVYRAYISFYCSSTGTVWLKVQRYANNNTTVLGEADHPLNATLIDVGIMSPAVPGYYWLDVTDAVAADIVAGKTYSSYLISPVQDAAGTPPEERPDEDIWSVPVAAGWDVHAFPHMDILYTSSEPQNCTDVIERGFGFAGDLDEDCKVNMNDLSIVAGDWLDCTSPGVDGCVSGGEPEISRTIVRGSAVVDANLVDWEGAEWIEWFPIDNTIFQQVPIDIPQAKMSLRWSEETNKIYAAVVVTDTTQILTPTYHDTYNLPEVDDYDASDRVEVYSQGSNAGGIGNYYDLSDNSQEYVVGPAPDSGYWTSWPLDVPLGGVPDPNFESAVVVDGNDIIYEFGVQMYDWYTGRGSTGETVVSQLEVDKLVRFEIVVISRWLAAELDLGHNSAGILSSDPELPYGVTNASDLPIYRLVEDISASCGGWGYVEGDISHDCVVDIEDLKLFAEDWILCNIPYGPGCIENW